MDVKDVSWPLFFFLITAGVAHSGPPPARDLKFLTNPFPFHLHMIMHLFHRTIISEHQGIHVIGELLTSLLTYPWNHRSE